MTNAKGYVKDFKKNVEWSDKLVQAISDWSRDTNGSAADDLQKKARKITFEMDSYTDTVPSTVNGPGDYDWERSVVPGAELRARKHNRLASNMLHQPGTLEEMIRGTEQDRLEKLIGASIVTNAGEIKVQDFLLKKAPKEYGDWLKDYRSYKEIDEIKKAFEKDGKINLRREDGEQFLQELEESGAKKIIEEQKAKYTANLAKRKLKPSKSELKDVEELTKMSIAAREFGKDTVKKGIEAKHDKLSKKMIEYDSRINLQTLYASGLTPYLDLSKTSTGDREMLQRLAYEIVK